MDHPSNTSPPSMHVPSLTASYGAQCPPRRGSSQISSKAGSKMASPVSIPNTRDDFAPPPLPPPRHFEEIGDGHDPGWRWGNTGSKGSFGNNGLGSVSPVSSLRGNWGKRLESGGIEERRRRSTALKPKPEKDLHDFRFQDEGYHSLSGSSIAHQLQGERPLERRNLQDSSHAYDKQLLSKIGRPKTPPWSSSVGSMDVSSPVSHGVYQQSTKHPIQLKQMSLSDRSMSASSDSLFKVGSPFGSRWADSPQSAAVSPSLISSAVSAKSFMDYRSPTFEGSNGSFSAGSRSDPFARMRHSARRADSDGLIGAGGFDEGASVASRSKRGGSYDQSIFCEPDLDSDFPSEETGGMRHLHLDDRTPPSIDVQSPDSRAGMKRRASSPLREAAHDDKASLQIVGGTSSDLYQRRTSGHLSTSRASPNNRYHPTHGSVSSTSSGGLQNGSYASSAGLSVGGSSITSISSHDRLSPSGISPLSDYHEGRDSPYVNPNSLDESPRSSISRPHQHITSDLKSTATIARKMSSDNTSRGSSLSNNNNNNNNGPKLQSNMHICDCCPKKPKKFDTAEELQNHQLEKQYTCQFCQNRFKNKNEAERHQNSLHLRRHSWSCATLDGNYLQAFHHCTAIPPNTNVSHAQQNPTGLPGQSDICGYCGMEFPNDPAPDWEARIAHLTGVHKFGECNQSKKFFRADHFRQHLKHSHAGTSGKWTNMLEAACMKDEPAPTPEAQHQDQLRLQQQGAPVANMMGGGSASRQGSFGGMGQMDLQFQKIEEENPGEMG